MIPPSISTDQIAAFVELARQGTLRAAAEILHVTEQGIRNRLLALEQRLGVELYRKSRGIRRGSPLTPHGLKFLPHALEFLEQATSMCDLFAEDDRPRDVHVVASQYLISYLLIDAARKFHLKYPRIRVRLSARTERFIEQALIDTPRFAFGVAAPYEPSPELVYDHLFGMNWSLITPRKHPLLKKQKTMLADVAEYSLILYEPGSTGRQHVIEAFRHQGLTPEVEMETTNTDLIVRMVEGGLGVSIVPLLPSGIVTRRRQVEARSLGEQIRAIDSGILTRKNEKLPTASQQFLDFVREQVTD